jgi:small subunit ribosomal protein S21
MIVIQIKKGENIERALKRYKYKVLKTKQLEMLKENREFTKPSVKRRKQKQKARYKQLKKGSED